MSVEHLTTDELFALLPFYVRVDGDLYFFKLIIGAHSVICWYAMNESEGGSVLLGVRNSGKTLKDCLKNMVEFLIEKKFIKI